MYRSWKIGFGLSVNFNRLLVGFCVGTVIRKKWYYLLVMFVLYVGVE